MCYTLITDRPLSSVQLSYVMKTYIVRTNTHEGGLTEFPLYTVDGEKVGPDVKVDYFQDQVGVSPEAVQAIIKNLAGKTFTLLDATITNEKQLKSMKDIIRGYVSDTHRVTQEVCYGSQITSQPEV